MDYQSSCTKNNSGLPELKKETYVTSQRSKIEKTKSRGKDPVLKFFENHPKVRANSKSSWEEKLRKEICLSYISLDLNE